MKSTDKQTYFKQQLRPDRITSSFDEFDQELKSKLPLDTKISTVLRMMVQQTGCSKASIFRVLDGQVLPRHYQWPEDGGSQGNNYNLEKRLSLESIGLDHWSARLRSNELISGRTTEFNGKEQEFLLRDGGKSFMLIPIVLEDTDWWGFVELTNSSDDASWAAESNELLHRVASAAGLAMHEDEVNKSKNMSHTDLIELSLREELLSAELDEISSWKNQILSTFSHEFQTPLYTLLGFSKTLLENEELDSDKEIRMTCLEHIYEQSRRLEKLVNNMMFASRLHTKSLRVEKHLIDLRSVLSAVHKWADEKAADSKLDFYIEEPQAPVDITCDPGKIERLLESILENAFVHTPSPGWVSVKVIPEADNVVIIIADTGTGISAANVGRIFEPFFTAPSKLNSESGVGLGLSIAKEIVDLHKGFITVESREGEGSVFTITLPRSLDESVRALQ
jgi:signal transduction histidine kinase